MSRNRRPGDARAGSTRGDAPASCVVRATSTSLHTVAAAVNACLLGAPLSSGSLPGHEVILRPSHVVHRALGAIPSGRDRRPLARRRGICAAPLPPQRHGIAIPIPHEAVALVTRA